MPIIRPSSSSDPTASRMAEQRLRAWTLSLEAHQREAAQISEADLPRQVCPYITISREAGAGGGAVARRVAEILGWDVLHRELLDHMAEKFDLPRDMLGLVDEKTSNWIVEMFGKWLDPRLVTQSEYIVHLGRIVLMAAQGGSHVFVGRGAQFFLPPDRGLTVFLVAPVAERVEYLKELRGFSHVQAHKYIRETDQGRKKLIKNHFNKHIGDPHLYDLVLNRTHMSVEAVVELIVEQFRKRFPED